MHDWPVSVVPNAIDTEIWRPVDKAQARSLMGLPATAQLLLFGAEGGSTDPRKGFDLLTQALDRLHQQIPNLQLVVFGQREPKNSLDLPLPVHFAGHLHDDLSLRVLYSAADAFIIPSRQDNLPNTGVEAQACGTPVVAFHTGGLADIVSHRHTGYLAEPFDPASLAAGCQWVMEEVSRHDDLRRAARARAVALWSSEVIGKRYRELYEAILADRARTDTFTPISS
jgi:glycosyltransferase involved in cell wall biosynthesis